MCRISIAAAALATSVLAAGAAQASQGPGIANGTAGPTAQLAMAILVYGGSALLIVWGGIGAIRQR